MKSESCLISLRLVWFLLATTKDHKKCCNSKAPSGQGPLKALNYNISYGLFVVRSLMKSVIKDSLFNMMAALDAHI